MDFAFSIFRRWNRRWKQWTWSTPTTMWHCWDLAKTTTPLWGSLLSLGWSAPWCRRRKSWWQRKRSRLCGRFAKNMWLVARYLSVLLRSSKLSLEIFFILFSVTYCWCRNATVADQLRQCLRTKIVSISHTVLKPFCENMEILQTCSPRSSDFWTNHATAMLIFDFEAWRSRCSSERTTLENQADRILSFPNQIGFSSNNKKNHKDTRQEKQQLKCQISIS